MQLNETLTKRVRLHVGESAFDVSLPESAIEIAVDDIEVAVDDQSITQCLDNPVEFPALSEALVPGDRVTVAVEPGFSDADSIVIEVLDYLRRHHVTHSQIIVLLAQPNAWMLDGLHARASAACGGDIDIQLHDPMHAEGLGYLAADHNGDPIYVHRALLDADLVLPISCIRDPKSWGYAGLYGIVPWFTDAKTQQRWRIDAAKASNHHSQKRLSLAKEIAWLLGIQPVLAIMPGPRNKIMAMHFGCVDGVEKLVSDNWSSQAVAPPTQLGNLLIATIDGDRTQQTWDNVARILYMAEQFLFPDGSIAIVTDLDELPGSPFRWLSTPDSRDEAEKRLLKTQHPNTLAAVEILRSLTKHRVYMMSQLPGDQVEDWGFVAMDSIQQLQHLVQSHELTIVMDSAQNRRLIAWSDIATQ